MHNKEERRQRRHAAELASASGAALRAHARRVARLAVAAADALETGEAVRHEVEVTALLHDIGKVALPYRLLNKPTPLDEAEWVVMRTHTVEGEHLCVANGLPARIGALVRATHERWDGKGYPDGLSGADIPLAARIVCAADAYDAMTTPRPYRPPLPVATALEELRAGAGAQFDPVVALRLAVVVERLEGRFRRTARDRNPAAAFAAARL